MNVRSVKVGGVVQGAAKIAVLGGKTVSSVLGVPMLDTGLALIDHVLRACQEIPIQKKKVKAMVANCESLRILLMDAALKGTLIEGHVRVVAESLEYVQKDLSKIPKYGIVKRFLMYPDIGQQLTDSNDEITRRLRDLIVLTTTSTHVAIKEVQESVAEDFRETRDLIRGIATSEARLNQLRRNQNEAAQVRATGEADIRVWRELPEEIDPQDLAEFERLLQSMSLPKGIDILTGKVSTRYELKDTGIYTSVYEGTFDGKKVALKCPRAVVRYERALRRFSREVTIWATVKHENILQFYGISEDKDLGVCIVSPWQKNGNLLEYIEAEPNAHRLKLLLGAAKGLEFLHNRTICHGNLKCANILVSNEGSALLYDFKLAYLLEPSPSSVVSEMTKRTLTRWSAPELIKQVTGATRPSDIYSFAMTILEAITLKKPYKEMKNEQHVRVAVGFRGLRPSRPPPGPNVDRWLSDDLWQLMNKCWQTKPYARPNVHEVVELLRRIAILHPVERWQPKLRRQSSF